MRQRTPSPPLITGIDGIVSRPPNEVNYSTLNEKRMEPGKQAGKEIRRKYKKHGISGNMVNYVKKEENAGKDEYLIEPGDENKIDTIKKDIGSDGEEGGDTGEPQRKKCSEAIANSENSNTGSSNTAITVRMLEEQVRNMKTLVTKNRAETVEALNGKRMESEKQSGNILRQKYNKIWTKNLAQDLKEGKYTSKIKILNKRVNENKNENDMIENKVENDGEEDGVTREAQKQKFENATSNNDSTNDNICNNSTSAGRNIDNGSEKLINTETDTLTTNDEGNKGEEEEEEEEAEAEADANSKIPNKSNGIGSSDSESSSNTVITLQLLEEQVRKMNTLQTRINREWPEAEAEAEAEVEEDANSEIPNNNNNIGSSSSDSKSNYAENKILNRRTNKNENKMIGNNVGQDREDNEYERKNTSYSASS